MEQRILVEEGQPSDTQKDTLFHEVIHAISDEMNLELSEDDKLDILVSVCQKCADLLKDPTEGGTIELTSEKRTEVRELAHDDLIIVVDTIASAARYNTGFFTVLSIASRLKIDVTRS